MIYGYARVSTRVQMEGTSLEAQEAALREAGASAVYQDVYTGTTSDRPELSALLDKLQEGDTLVVTKLDRIARSAREGLNLIDQINSKGASIKILNMGTIDDTSLGKLIRTIMFAFAEFERDMIVERTKEGKRIARQNEGYKEGRPFKYKEAVMDHAMSLLADHSFSQVAKMTGISTATLKRHKKARSKSLSV